MWSDVWVNQVLPAVVGIVGAILSVLGSVAIAWLKGASKAKIIETAVFAVEQELKGQPGETKLLEVLKRLGSDPRVRQWTQAEIEAAVAKLPAVPRAVSATADLAEVAAGTSDERLLNLVEEAVTRAISSAVSPAK